MGVLFNPCTLQPPVAVKCLADQYQHPHDYDHAAMIVMQRGEPFVVEATPSGVQVQARPAHPTSPTAREGSPFVLALRPSLPLLPRAVFQIRRYDERIFLSLATTIAVAPLRQQVMLVVGAAGFGGVWLRLASHCQRDRCPCVARWYSCRRISEIIYNST